MKSDDYLKYLHWNLHFEKKAFPIVSEAAPAVLSEVSEYRFLPDVYKMSLLLSFSLMNIQELEIIKARLDCVISAVSGLVKSIELLEDMYRQLEVNKSVFNPHAERWSDAGVTKRGSEYQKGRLHIYSPDGRVCNYSKYHGKYLDSEGYDQKGFDLQGNIRPESLPEVALD